MKKTVKGVLCFALIICLFLQGCGSYRQGLPEAASGQTTDNSKETAEQLEKEMSAFEITAYQRELAAKNEAGYPVLDVGRSNPNWINTQSRYAFARFMEFATAECQRTEHTKPDIYGLHGPDPSGLQK